MKKASAALELFPYGLFVVGAGREGNEATIVATWAMQVSFHPPLVAIAIESDSHMRRVIEQERRFSINFLPAGGLATARAYAKPGTSGKNGERSVEFSKNGFLFVRGAAGSIGCTMIGAHETGDHVTFVGEVVEVSDHPAGPVLTLRDTGWTYRK